MSTGSAIVATINDFLYGDLQSREKLVQFSLDSFSPKEIAGVLSDGATKDSNKYKSALRQAYLYKQGKRRPGKEFEAKLRKSAKEEREKTVTRAKMTIVGVFEKSRDRRVRTLVATINPNKYKDLSEDEAMEIFMLDDYGVDDATMIDYKVTVERA